MNNKLREDVTPIFKMAQDWFRNSPDEQMPLDEWHKHFKNEAQLSYLSDGVFKVSKVGKEIIPALAAISLGASPEQLSAIMLHHNVTATELARCTFASERQIYIDTPKNSLTPWHTTNELTRGFAHLPELKKHFLNDYPLVSKSTEMKLSVQMNDFEALWDITKAKQLISEIAAGEHAATWIYDFTDLMEYARIEYELKSFTDKDLFVLLERTGQLCINADHEYGFSNQFFGELFLNAKDLQTSKRFIKAINNIEDPVLLRMVSQRIFETLRQYELSFGDAPKSLIEMRKHLDPVKFKALFESTLLKLAVLTAPGLSGLCITHPALIEDPCFEDFVQNPRSMVRQLHQELMTVDATAFKKVHFMAIENTFSKDMPAQDISSTDIHQLLMHALDALSHYGERLDNLKSGFKKSKFSVAAEKSLETLVRFALSQIDLDYQRLSTLPSGAKAYLTTFGLDIKKLPGISNKHRGQLLSDQLGL